MPQVLGLAEDLTGAVVAKLKANLPTRIAAINAAATDDIVLSIPRDQDYYEVGIEALPQTPAIVVREMRSSFSLEGSHSLLSDTEVLVYVLEADPHRVILGKRLQRQAQAIIGALWDSDPYEKLTMSVGQNYSIEPIATEPGRVFEPAAPDDWRGFYVVVFRAKTLEQ